MIIDADTFQIELGNADENGDCEVSVHRDGICILSGKLTYEARQRFMGSVRGDYSVWHASGPAFQAALQAYYKTPDVDSYGDGRENFRRSLAAAIAAFLMASGTQVPFSGD